MNDDLAFLGRGWAFPPAFSANGQSVALATGVEDIHQSLKILLGTRLGERIMREDFGCALDETLFEEIDQHLSNAISDLIRTAITYHEARINVDNVDVTPDADQAGLLRITIDYTVRSTNSRFNLVYPFYVLESAYDVGLRNS